MKLRDIDFLGGNINFSVNKSTKLKSNLGGFFTIFLGIIIGLLLFGFGRDFFKRQNPIVIRSVNIPDDYQFINMTTKEISFAIRFEDFDGNAIKNDRAFYLGGQYFYQKMKEDGEWDILEEEIEFRECDSSDFPEGPFNSDEVAKDYMCPKFDGRIFGGFWTNDIVSNFIFRVYYCSEGFENPKGEKCISNNEKDEILKDIAYISLYQESLEAFPLSYDTPIKRNVDNIFFVLDKQATKGVTVNFKNTTVITDYGWMIEDKTKLSKVGVGSYFVDVFNINLHNPKNGPYMISEITLYYSKDSDEYIRAYQKLSELAANVGGILEIFLIAGYTTVAFYNDCKNMLEFNYYTSLIENPNPIVKSIVESNKLVLKNNLFSLNEFDKGFNQSNKAHKKTSSTNIANTERKIDSQDLKSENLVLSNNLNDYSTVKGNALHENSIVNVSPDSNKLTNNLVKINVINDNNFNSISKSVESDQSQYKSNEIKVEDASIKKDDFSFGEIFQSLAFRNSSEGKLLCFSKEKVQYYKTIEEKYEHALSFKKFISLHSTVERIKEILFTNDQLLVLQSD